MCFIAIYQFVACACFVPCTYRAGTDATVLIDAVGGRAGIALWSRADRHGHRLLAMRQRCRAGRENPWRAANNFTEPEAPPSA
jgi:hypothetical protein